MNIIFKWIIYLHSELIHLSWSIFFTWTCNCHLRQEANDKTIILKTQMATFQSRWYSGRWWMLECVFLQNCLRVFVPYYSFFCPDRFMYLWTILRKIIKSFLFRMKFLITMQYNTTEYSSPEDDVRDVLGRICIWNQRSQNWEVSNNNCHRTAPAQYTLKA